jgi:hypothetical protein
MITEQLTGKDREGPVCNPKTQSSPGSQLSDRDSMTGGAESRPLSKHAVTMCAAI